MNREANRRAWNLHQVDHFVVIFAHSFADRGKMTDVITRVIAVTLGFHSNFSLLKEV
jgi:hypothetical protein